MSQSFPEPRAFRYADIEAGMKQEREYVISAGVSAHFLAAFDDRSPVHVDEDYAQAHGFPARVTHGAILNGFLSHFIGMHFPGEPALLLAVDIRFSQPCHEGDVIRIEAVVSGKLDAHNVVVLDVVFNNVTRTRPAARARVQVMVRDAP